MLDTVVTGIHCAEATAVLTGNVREVAPLLQVPSANLCSVLSFWWEMLTVQLRCRKQIPWLSWLEHCWGFSCICHWESPQKEEELRYLVIENCRAAVWKVARMYRVHFHSPSSCHSLVFIQTKSALGFLLKEKKEFPKKWEDPLRVPLEQALAGSATCSEKDPTLSTSTVSPTML